MEKTVDCPHMRPGVDPLGSFLEARRALQAAVAGMVEERILSTNTGSDGGGSMLDERTLCFDWGPGWPALDFLPSPPFEAAGGMWGIR